MATRNVIENSAKKNGINKQTDMQMTLLTGVWLTPLAAVDGCPARAFQGTTLESARSSHAESSMIWLATVPCDFVGCDDLRTSDTRGRVVLRSNMMVNDDDIDDRAVVCDTLDTVQ